MNRAVQELAYLAASHRPLWGAHLERGDPLNPMLAEYLRNGLIERVGDEGYRITERGRRFVRAREDHQRK